MASKTLYVTCRECDHEHEFECKVVYGAWEGDDDLDTRDADDSVCEACGESLASASGYYGGSSHKGEDFHADG